MHREWIEKDSGGEYSLVRTISDSIGKFISTKAVLSNSRQDLTNEYKYKEGSVAERSTVVGALDNSGKTFVR